MLVPDQEPLLVASRVQQPPSYSGGYEPLESFQGIYVGCTVEQARVIRTSFSKPNLHF